MKDHRKDLKNENEIMFDRKKDIIEKATWLFYEQGYDNTSARQLASATEFSLAGLYYHFKTKEEMLFTIINGVLDELLEYLRSAIIKEDNPEMNLRRIIKKSVQASIDHKRAFCLNQKERERLNQEHLSIVNEKNREAVALVNNELARLIEQGKFKSINITNATFLLIAMMNFLIHWHGDGDSPNIQELADDITEIFFYGSFSRTT